MRDASLDEFLDGSGENDSEPTNEASDSNIQDGSDEVDDDPADTGPSAEVTESITATYTWTSEGATCADCGGTVERRWRAENRWVCDECKEW